MSDDRDVKEAVDRLVGHSCMICPVEIRNLLATAHNLLVRFDGIKTGVFGWTDVYQKLQELKDALGLMESAKAAHFTAIALEQERKRRGQ